MWFRKRQITGEARGYCGASFSLRGASAPPVQGDIPDRSHQRHGGAKAPRKLKLAPPALIGFGTMLLLAFAAHGELDQWVANVESGSKLDAVFFRAFPVGTGSVTARRSPKETRAELSKLIADAPAEADYLSLRALEAEKQLDFPAAEADWKKYVELAKDKTAANIALADYYHRRLMPREEIAALRAAAAIPSPDSEPSPQKAWTAFERIVALIDEQLLGSTTAAEQYQAWVARYPKEPEVYRRACLALIAKKQFPAAEELLAAYERVFPDAAEFPTEARAGIELAKGSPAAALAAYEKSFQPLWSEQLAADYFSLLKEEGLLRKSVDQAHARIAANPVDLNAATRLFYYYRTQNDSAGAAHALVDFRKRKDAARSIWTPAEHETLATLFDRTNQYDDSARHYHALYVHRAATPQQTELALAGLVDLLLNAAEQPIQIGAGDLSYYRDVATMDRSPGYLNGVLSLLLNSQNPANEYAQQSGNAVSYFHRAKAAQLDQLFEQRYPKSERRAGLRAKLIQAYATYGDTKAVIDNGRLFLTAFPAAPRRTEVALLMADGYARLNQTDNEFALYRQLLVDLAAKAGGKPIGATAVEAPPPAPNDAPPVEDRATRLVNQTAARTAKSDGGVKSQDYVRVLDRYLARLVSLNRMPDALRVYRGELTRNASDPGLYERFAAFLDQNKLGTEIERVYKDAMQRFPDDTQWSHRLARWYLRGRQQAKYGELTRQVTNIFSGTALEAYIRETGGGVVGAQLYLQVNQYAHQRFPHNLSFVRNLLTLYQARGTANPATYEQLLRENWFYAGDLRSRFFELLSRTRRLDTELAALRTAKPDPAQNPAAARMLAEGEAWKTNYEAAAAPFRALATALPAELELDERAAGLHRSLSRTDVAVQIEANLAKADPRSRAVLTHIGEIEADRERFDRASPPWIKMASLEPGNAEGYLDAATVFWDYFQYSDALKMIGQARVKLGNPSLYAYESGAIRENQRDYAAALNEYAKGAMAEGAGRSRDRLLKLGQRKSLSAPAEALTAGLGASQNSANISLRIGFLEGQSRAADLQQYLTSTLASATSADVITLIDNSARANDFKAVQQRVIERRIAITTDPVELLRTRVELARFYESQNNLTKAAETVDALSRENPAVYGVIRNAVNYYWRNKQPARAVDLLVASADRAQQPYQDRFRFEAAQKSLEAGQYDRGQQLIGALLDKEPHRADYLALSGDVYARRGDDAGLRTYYVNTIASLQKSPLSAEEKAARVASLRRSFVAVLARLKDYSGAVDQYIEVINRYPEDEVLVQEAAQFALQNGQQGRLIDYYIKTAAGSPRDHRWPIVLSRMQWQAGNYPAALEWLGKARAIRPERTDFLAAKGPLEERLLKFEDAAKTYVNLWELSYHDPSWMVKAGEQYERLGRHSDAVAALSKAFIDGRPDSPNNYLSAATQSMQWNELDAARDFLKKGNGPTTGLQALEGVLAARQHSTMPLPVANMDSTVAARWGEAVATYATPEEKAAYSAKLTVATGTQLATVAEFAELLSKWEPEIRDGALNVPWLQLMTQRARFDEIGPRLEAASRNGTLKVEQRDALLAIARQHYAQAGDAQAELRLLEQRRAAGDGRSIARYAQLAARDPRIALAIVSSDPLPALRDAVANRVFANGRASDALAIVQARGTAFKPVWTNAYTALTGVYFDVKTPQIRAAFDAVLGPRTIGEQLGHAPNEDVQVTGAPWFYYAGRYGEYLGSEDYLLSELEESPGSSAAYASLADYYQDRGDLQRALVEYDYVLQLDPSSPVPHLRKAKALAASSNLPSATEEWKLALAGFQRAIDSKPSATWWTDLATGLGDIAQYKALASVRDDTDRVLRANFKRNGQYNSDALVPAILTMPGAGGVQWLMDLSRSAPEPNQVLDSALQQNSPSDADRDLLWAREVENAQAKADATLGDARSYLLENVANTQMRRLQDSMARGNIAAADRLLRQLPAAVLESNRTKVAGFRIRIAAKQGTLSQLLAQFDQDPAHALASEALSAAAADLRAANDEASANRVLEYLYGRELTNRNFTGPNFLGLAAVKLANNDLPTALDLLRRMNLTVGVPFEWLNESAQLLWRTGHRKEAGEYFDQLVKVQPWEPAHRLHAAQAKPETAMLDLAAVAKNPQATYAIRVEAAQELRKAGGLEALASGAPELDLIAGKTPITEPQASQPFYLASRLLASENVTPAARFRLLSAAVSTAPSPVLRTRLFRSAFELKRWSLANALIEDVDNDVGLLRSYAEVKLQLGDVPGALQFQTKLSAGLTGPAKAEMDRLIASENADLARLATNEARRPVIAEPILPDRVVRPRLTEGVRQ